MFSLRKKTLSMFLIVSLFIGIIGVISVDTTYAASKKIHLKKKTITLVVGHKDYQRLIKKNGKKIKGSKVKWRSSKKSVATINKDGFIKTKKPGTAKMTAKYKGKIYKFKVKVKKPSFSGTNIKPTLTEIKYRTNNTDRWINPTWTTVKDATHYELYMSINDGEYKRKQTTSTYVGLIRNPIPECKYSFKVRATAGKNGKYKTGFSDIKSIIVHKDGSYEVYDKDMSPIVKPDHNTSIKIEQSSISLDIGETKTVNVITDGGYSITSQQNNNNVSCSWGEWISGTKKITLNITGVKAGTTTIDVYDTKDNSIRDSIVVTVGSSLEYLYNYIQENGGVDSDGNRGLAYYVDSNGNGRVMFINHSNYIEFIYLDNRDNTNYETSASIEMKMYLPQTSNAKPEITFYYKNDTGNEAYFTGYAYVNCSTYTENSNIKFYFEEYNMPSEPHAQKLCNDFLRLAMDSWGLTLQVKTGINLEDIGFTNYLS